MKHHWLREYGAINCWLPNHRHISVSTNWHLSVVKTVLKNGVLLVQKMFQLRHLLFSVAHYHQWHTLFNTNFLYNWMSLHGRPHTLHIICYISPFPALTWYSCHCVCHVPHLLVVSLPVAWLVGQHLLLIHLPWLCFVLQTSMSLLQSSAETPIFVRTNSVSILCCKPCLAFTVGGLPRYS